MGKNRSSRKRAAQGVRKASGKRETKKKDWDELGPAGFTGSNSIHNSRE